MSAKISTSIFKLVSLFAIIFLQSAFAFAQVPKYKISYSTYLGGDDYSAIRGIDIDGAGNIYLVGETRSEKLPVTENALEKKLDAAGWDHASFLQVLDLTGKLVYSTYLNNATGVKIKADSDGFVYLTGQNYSPYPGQTNYKPFYTTPNAFQSDGNRFVMKLDIKKGKIIYAARLGGKGLLDANLEVDRQGNVFVAGITDSPDFPVTPDALQKTFAKNKDFQSTGFITKLNSDGTELVYSTFLGNPDEFAIRDFKIDPEGNAYLTGYTKSSDFPATPDAYRKAFRVDYSNDSNGFLLKLNSGGNKILYSTFVGGTDSSCNSIAISEKGNIYLAGQTNAEGFMTTKDAYQPKLRGKDQNIFILKFNSSLTDLDYSTFLGGGQSSISKIIVDKAGKIYAVGEINSNNLPTTKSAYQRNWGGFNFFKALLSDRLPYDAFLSVISPSDIRLDYSTFIGGLGDDGASDLVRDAEGNIYIVGQTESSKFPITRDALQPKWKVSAGFLTKFSKIR